MGWQWSTVFVVAVGCIVAPGQGMAREIALTTLGGGGVLALDISFVCSEV